MKKKPQTNEAQTYLTIQQHDDFDSAVDAFFRKRGLEARDYRAKGAAVINEIKRRKALEIKEL